MNNKEAIKLILEYYNEIKDIAKNDNFVKGELCAIRYILIEVYGFNVNDKRF